MRLPQEQNGRLKGFGYAEFADRESLLSALALNNEVSNATLWWLSWLQSSWSACLILADSEQLEKSWRNWHICFSCMDHFNYHLTITVTIIVMVIVLFIIVTIIVFIISVIIISSSINIIVSIISFIIIAGLDKEIKIQIGLSFRNLHFSSTVFSWSCFDKSSVKQVKNSFVSNF